MRRREFLTGITIVCGAFAGCSTLVGDSGTTTQSPTARTTSSSTGTSKPTPEDTASSPEEPQPQGDASAEVGRQTFVSEERPSGDTDYFMTGLIENTGEVPLASPEVSVEFYDDTSQVIGVTSEEITRLEPGQVWDVRTEYLGADDDPEPVNGRISFVTPEPAATYSHPTELTIEKATLETKTPPEVTGTVTNMTDATLDSVFGYADFIADNGYVLGMGEDSTAEINSGDSWDFTLDYITFDEKRIERIADYELYFVI